MIKDMDSSDELFKPTNFWTQGIKNILNDLKSDKDFSNFRNHKSAVAMYVPVYEHGLYKKHRKYIDRIFGVRYNNEPKPEVEGIFGTLSGYNLAKSDYRVFRGTDTDIHPKVSNVSESKVGNPVDYYCFESKFYSRSFLNYLMGINFLKRCVDTQKVKSVFEIGGGYGTLGEIILKSDQDAFYLNVDIPPVSAVSTFYLSQVFGEKNILSYTESRDLDIIDIDEIKKKYKAAVLCPWQLPKLEGKFELFVNFMSFQEMEPHIVKNYVSIAEKHTNSYVLTRNSRSGKKTASNNKSIGVINPLKTDSLYEMFENFSLVKKDYLVFGQYAKSFQSEVACLKRNL